MFDAPLKSLLKLGFALPLIFAACGYHLRGEIPGDPKEKTMYLVGIGPSNPFYGDFTFLLTSAGGKVANQASEAGVIVNIISANHLRRNITLSAVGQANMFELTFRVRYDVENTKGDILLAEQEINTRREYFNTQSSPLGMGYEEAEIRTEMQKDAAQTLLRRILFSLEESKKEAATQASNHSENSGK